MPSAIITQVASSVPFDNTLNEGFVGTDVQTVLGELRDHTIYDSQTQATTTNGTLTLTSTNPNAQILTGSATGYSVQLPSATTLSLTAYYQIFNQSSVPVTIKDGSGATLFVLGETSIGHVYLQLNGTTAGTWIYWQTSTDIVEDLPIYKITSTTAFATSASVDTLITGMTITPVAGTYAVWYSSTNTGTGSGQTLNSTVYQGASAIADSARQDASPSGTHIFSVQTLTTFQFNGTTACSIYVNANGNSITVNSRTMLLIRLGV